MDGPTDGPTTQIIEDIVDPKNRYKPSLKQVLIKKYKH